MINMPLIQPRLTSLGRLLVAVFYLFLCGSVTAYSNEYYLSPSGSDSNYGTIDSPWLSLDWANRNVSAGDSVILLPGEYAGTIRPMQSGTKSRPIIYRAAKRRTAILLGPKNHKFTSFAIHLVAVNHIRLNGLVVDTKYQPGMRWAYVNNTMDVQVSDSSMRSALSKTPFVVRNSDGFRLITSELSRHKPNGDYVGNMVVFGYNRNTLIAGSSFSKAGHSPLMFYPAGSNSNLILRGNVFHGEWGRSMSLFDVRNVLVENNIFTNAYNGGQSADGQTKWFSKNGIFRYNRIISNGGIAINGNTYKSSLHLDNLRIYNNVFANNYGAAIQFNGPPERTKDVRFFNNIFTDNDRYGGYSQIRGWKLAERGLVFENNVINGTVWLDGTIRSGRILKSVSDFNRNRQFSRNLQIIPDLVDSAENNFSIVENGNLIDQGVFLAHTASMCQGNSVVVTDAYSFFDGFGFDDEIGDLVQVGFESNFAHITKIDRENSVLIFDRPVVCKKNVPVSLRWSGEKPDVGLYEIGGNGRLNIEVNQRQGGLSTEFMFRADLSGIDAERIEWHFGDGTIATQKQIIGKKYLHAGNYPVRLSVLDRDGRSHYFTEFVKVSDESCCSRELLRSSFDRNDTSWWWQWQAYRPAPAAFALEPVENNENLALHIYAPMDGGRLSVQIFPLGWQIDKFPVIRFKYKIEPGTSVHACIYGFEVADSLREFCPLTSGNLVSGSDGDFGRLIADGAWHSAEINAKLIRHNHPRVKYLKSFSISAVDYNQVERGQGYWLDDFRIERFE